jgi:hypothetical protein
LSCLHDGVAQLGFAGPQPTVQQNPEGLRWPPAGLYRSFVLQEEGCALVEDVSLLSVQASDDGGFDFDR